MNFFEVRNSLIVNQIADILNFSFATALGREALAHSLPLAAQKNLKRFHVLLREVDGAKQRRKAVFGQDSAARTAECGSTALGAIAPRTGHGRKLPRRVPSLVGGDLQIH